MTEIDKYLDEVCRTLGGSRSLRQHIREELQEHLDEAVEAHVAKGMLREEAVTKAIEDFGRPGDVGKDLESVYGHRMMSLAIDKAMDWKERTMKSGWKWSFMGTLALLCVIAAEVALALCLVVFIFPRIQETYEGLGSLLPNYYLTTLSNLRFIREEWVWILGLLIAAWALFEWRIKSESKQVIRLCTGGVVALIAALASWWVTIVTVVPLVQAIGLIMTQDPRPAVAARLDDAASAMTRLTKAVAEEDLATAASAGGRLSTALLYLNSARMATALAAMRPPADADRILRLLDDLQESDRKFNRSMAPGFRRRYLPPSAHDGLKDLQKSWDAFCKEVRCESTDAGAPIPIPANGPSAQGDSNE